MRCRERIDVGTMIEVPALLYQLDELLKKVDFVSVGSNDLFQFMFAVDRGNAKVSERFDTLSAPILRALRDIVRKADAAKKTASLCGEMASKPLGALALIALGYRSLSMVRYRTWSGQGDDSRPRRQKGRGHADAAAGRPVGQRLDPREADRVRGSRRPVVVARLRPANAAFAFTARDHRHVA